MARRFVERARRFQVRRKGELRLDEHRFKGLIQNISDKGLFVVSNYDLKVGMELWIKVELAPGLPFEGKLKVRHFDDGCFGAEIRTPAIDRLAAFHHRQARGKDIVERSMHALVAQPCPWSQVRHESTSSFHGVS